MNHKSVENGAEKPQIWHYGLMARDWIEFFTEPGVEGAYFKELIKSAGGPALDLGCGSGRLLLPFLKAGLNVEGCDYSADMLAVCKENLAAHGVDTQLHQQGIHELDLGRTYKVIIACGVIGLGGSKRLARQGMARCYAHLEPGGLFAFDYETPWNDPPYWNGWLPEGRRSLPTAWFQPEAERLLMSDGNYLENTVRIISQDPLNGTAVKQIRFRVWQGDELIEEEIQTLESEGYLKDELLLMLELAGFEDVKIFGDYTDQPATMDHKNLVFVAKK